MIGMSHQEEWMPSMVKVILPIQDGDYTDGEIQRAFWLAGLRAQIAVLEEMLEREMVSMRHDNDYRVRAVPQVSIINKIAALRKELER